MILAIFRRYWSQFCLKIFDIFKIPKLKYVIQKFSLPKKIVYSLKIYV